MKVALVTPNFHEMRGNTITVQRISKGLENIGVQTEILSITRDKDFPKLPNASIIHGFNAYQFYHYWKKEGSPHVPYIITLTGTDLNHDLFNEKRRDFIEEVLLHAKAVHVFNKQAKEILLSVVPSIKEKLYLIPQSVEPLPLQSIAVGKEEGSFLFVLPAGIRRIKNIPAAINMLKKSYQRNKNIRLWLVGPEIEHQEAKQVKNLVDENREWIHYLGSIPHQTMSGVYELADVVLNTSISEGQSGALLEAMMFGKPVLVSNNTGNKDIIAHGKVGFVYNTEDEFATYVEELIHNHQLRKQMGAHGKGYIQEKHSPQKEVEAIHNLYVQALNQEK